MLKTAKNYFNIALKQCGYEIYRSGQFKLLDLSTEAIHPIEAYYLSKGRPILMNIPIEKCFSIDFSGANRNNPFVETLIAYNSKKCTSYFDSPLRDFYNNWQPLTANQSKIDGKELAPPWDYGLRIESNLASARLIRKDFMKVRKELGISHADIHGHISRGPVSDGFGEVTFNRLVKVYNSIKAHGYDPVKMKSEHITASFFLSGSEYMVSVSSGKHRITALQALGHKKIPIQFGPPKFPVIVRREDVDYWPNVRAGHYTKEEALNLFDKKFNNEHPSRWIWANKN